MMTVKKAFLQLMVLLNAATATAGLPDHWLRLETGIAEGRVNCVASAPDGQGRQALLIGTDKALYRTDGEGEPDVILRLSASERGINCIHLDPADGRLIYAATDDGLFFSSDGGRRWSRIYSESGGRGRCRAVVALGNRVFAGTMNGLFVKNDGRWQGLTGELGTSPIYDLDLYQGDVIAASSSVIYRIRVDDLRPEKILVLAGQEASADLVAAGADGGETSAGDQRIIWDLEAVGNDVLVAATRQGIFYGSDLAKGFRRLVAAGLPENDITSVSVIPAATISPEHFPAGSLIFAGTGRGVFVLRDTVWEPVYKGLDAARTSFLTHTPDGSVYAATDKGVFTLIGSGADNGERGEISAGGNGAGSGPATAGPFAEGPAFVEEPTIREVQQMAIDYAEVRPEKIRSWRRLAQQKAWLPSVNISADIDKNKTVADSIWGSYTAGGQHYVGPDDKTFYANNGYSASLSWDLGDLVWNPNQTSIDSRSKLMVELREDILDQVTRLYFERRRIQRELLAAPAVEPQARADKELRVEELTALIDAFTGGNFSQQIEDRKEDAR